MARSFIGGALALMLGYSAPAIAGDSTTLALVDVTSDGVGRWLFRQGGFEEGAEVIGFFEGTDLDGNGQLSSFDFEVTGFSMSWSGNSLASAFSLDYLEVLGPYQFGLVYDLDGGPLGDGLTMDIEGIRANNFPNFYYAGIGPIFECSQAGRCGIVAVLDVPAPAALALFGLGLVGLGGATRRR